VKSQSFIEWDDCFGTVENHFIAFEVAADAEEVFDQGSTDTMLLVIGMDCDILDVADNSARMNEFRLDKDRGRARNVSINDRDVCPDSGLEAIPVDVDGLLFG